MQPGHAPSAYLDRAILVNGDRITRLYRLEELVAKKVNGEDSTAIPDVVHE
jgi:hypothetical protein